MCGEMVFIALLVCAFFCACLFVHGRVSVREKYTLEQDIRETEEAIRHKSSEVQVRSMCCSWFPVNH